MFSKDWEIWKKKKKKKNRTSTEHSGLQTIADCGPSSSPRIWEVIKIFSHRQYYRTAAVLPLESQALEEGSLKNNNKNKIKPGEQIPDKATEILQGILLLAIMLPPITLEQQVSWVSQLGIADGLLTSKQTLRSLSRAKELPSSLPFDQGKGATGNVGQLNRPQREGIK